MSGSKYLSNLVHKLLHNNRFVAIFSLVVAIVMWLVISVSENPQRTMNLGGVPISINTQGTVVGTLGMEVVSDSHPKNVTVVVNGPSYIVSSLKSSDIIVTASLANVTDAGTYELELTAQRNSSKTGYTIVSVNPSKITVSFDVVDEKTFDLEFIAKGAEAASGLIIGDISVSNSLYNTITIKGPRTEMSKIATVAAVAKVNKTLTETDVYSANIVLYDENGQEMDSSLFDLSFDKVDVVVPVLREKRVNISVTASNTGVINYLNYSLSQYSVIIRGEPEEIDAITVAPVATIDFSKITSDGIGADGKYVLPVTLDLPSTVEIREVEDLSMTIYLGGHATKTLKVKKLATKDLAEGLSATFSSETVSVTVCGPKNVINAIKADDLTVYANCAGKSAGAYGLNCTIESTKYPSVWAVGNVTASVTIK